MWLLWLLLLWRESLRIWALDPLVISSARTPNYLCLDHMLCIVLGSGEASGYIPGKTGWIVGIHASLGPQLDAEKGLRLSIPSHIETWVCRIEFVNRLLEQSLSFLC